MFKRRTWGLWIVLINRKSFKLKLLRFKEGAALSRQYHNKRSELWLMLCGAGDMSLSASSIPQDNYTHLLAGEHINIPVGWWHKFIAKKTTWVLEVQYGQECKEKDIIRA